jgi:mannose/fructose/N-acetylgalactosamine-specific phosphotransferase system component IID
VKLNRRDLVRVFFRSFMIQGVWTVQRAQNLGYVYSLWPVFRRLHPKRDDRALSASAHSGYFSTHPYTAGFLLGVVAGMEEDRSEGNGLSTDTILVARSAMSGPLAALGEIFFWGTWLPFSLVFTLCAGMAGPAWLLASPLVYLIVFNIPHLFVRAMGVWLGYRWKLNVVSHLLPLRIQAFFPVVAVVGIGLVLFRIGFAPLTGIPVLTGFLWVIFFWGVLRLGVRPSYVALGVAGGSVAYSFARGWL